MNKLLKGSIAGAAGVALLLGGAGTFALWNSSTTVNGGAVASGTLTIAENGVDPIWEDVSADVAGGVIEIADYRIVPGDTLEMTQDVLINATGDNLEAKLAFNPLTVVTGTDLDNIALKNALDFTLTATPATSGTVVTDNGDGTFQIAPSDNEITVALTLTVEFPSDVEDLVAQGASVDLTGLGFNLTQTRP
jgi:alternate signal-mediated exported protein